MTIKEVVEKVKKKFEDDRKNYDTDAYYANGYIQALDDVVKAEEDICDCETDKDDIIKGLEREIQQLREDFGKKDEELEWSSINNDKLRNEIDRLKTEIALLKEIQPTSTECSEEKITVGVNKDGVIRDLETDIHRLKCEKEDLINHNEDLDIYLDELKIENRILSEKWKVVELFMQK